jgi:hypothetical protein
MSTHRLYIANPPEHALMRIESYGCSIGLGSEARSVLRECVARAWDDGFVEVSRGAHAALRELTDRGVIEVRESNTGTLVIRPLLLYSDVGTQAGVGWWQRLELDYDI